MAISEIGKNALTVLEKRYLAKDEEGNTVEPTEEESAAAWEEAQSTAQTILDAYDAGEELETVAEDFETATYSASEGASNSGSLYTDWCFEDGRKAGDSTIIEDEDNGKIYVVVFLNRYLDDSKTVNVRHILIKPVDSGLSSDDEGYEEAEALNNAQAETKAQDVLDEYLAGEHTAEAFGALAEEYSSDSNASDGGLYTQIYKGEMEDAFEEWCFDDSRKVGDTGIVETSYGYHVMYFQGEDIPYWQVRCKNGMYEQWQQDIYDAATVKEHVLGIKAAGGMRQ